MNECTAFYGRPAEVLFQDQKLGGRCGRAVEVVEDITDARNRPHGGVRFHVNLRMGI